MKHDMTKIRDALDAVSYAGDYDPAQLAVAKDALDELEVLRAQAEIINKPEIHDFLIGVEHEAAHQRLRWTADDGGKTDADWFWLVGYLAGKALHKDEKRLHHLITTAAALFNWHLATLGKTDMRPGIEMPKDGA